MKKYLLTAIVLTLTATCIFGESYINWASDDRASKAPGEVYFAHSIYPKGSRVRININGAEREFTVVDRTKDKRAEATVSAQVAKEFGFYYSGRDTVTTTLLASPLPTILNDDAPSSVWFDIKGIAPRKGQGLVQLYSVLIARGYKAVIDKDTKTITVKYIPEYRKDNELASLSLMSDVSSPPEALQIEL